MLQPSPASPASPSPAQPSHATKPEPANPDPLPPFAILALPAGGGVVFSVSFLVAKPCFWWGSGPERPRKTKKGRFFTGVVSFGVFPVFLRRSAPVQVWRHISDFGFFFWRAFSMAPFGFLGRCRVVLLRVAFRHSGSHGVPSGGLLSRAKILQK